MSYKKKSYDCEFLEDSFKYRLKMKNKKKVFQHIRTVENVKNLKKNTIHIYVIS